jgi:predicted acylesterase/phospholipase RssA
MECHRARRRFDVSVPEPSPSSWQAYRVFATKLRCRQWRDSERVVFGSGGAHGPVEIGGLVGLLGGWSDTETQRWLREKRRQLAGVSVGAIAAVGVALGIGPLRLAALNYHFPYRDIFTSDLKIGKAQAGMMDHLLRVRGVLGGNSLRTIAFIALHEGGAAEGTTFEQLFQRTGVDVRILATNLSTMRLVVFSASRSPKVRVMDAMVASMSIPGLFEPQFIEGFGECVDGGICDPFGLLAFSEDPPARTTWLCKFPNLMPERRADNFMSIILSIMGTHSGASLRKEWPLAGDTLSFVPLFPGCRHGLDERDSGNSLNLFGRPDVSGMILDGLESMDGVILTAWMLLVLFVHSRGGRRS